MTIITGSSETPDPIKPAEKEPLEPKQVHISTSGEKAPVLDVAKPVASVVKTQKSKYITQNIPKLSATNKLIKNLSLTEPFEKQNLKETLAIIDPGAHSMIFEDQVIYVSKIDDKTFAFGVASVAVKAFAKGGFGKVYNVDLINMNEPLVLKLSRKKSRIKNTPKLTLDKKQILEVKGGSSRGQRAKEELQKEYQIMKYIKANARSFVGINCDAYAYVTYKNQAGLFIKKYDFDGTKLIDYNPSLQCLLFVTKQLCHGYNQLYQLDIAHRDIKLENTLFNIIPNQVPFACKGVISDLGGACIIPKLFEEHPYPSFGQVMGNGTRRNTSRQIATQINNKLQELKPFKQDSAEYKQLKVEIIDLMVASDFFSLGVLVYRLWTDSNPPFASYRNSNYMSFDPGMTTKERSDVLERIELELLSVCQPLSAEEAQVVVEFTMESLREGLDVNK